MLGRTESETLRVATGMIWIPGGTHGLRQALCGSGAGPNPETDVQKTSCIPENPRGRRDNASSDPNLPDIKIPRKVIRGGSHLCAPNYRGHHRRAARMLSPSTRPRTTSASLRGEKFRRNDAANAFLSRR
jgi:hypothetical protein